jgi:crotonobetainyl-CoA:carnitine CoA-transferase CaiB-like acyl-CoA transferase
VRHVRPAFPRTLELAHLLHDPAFADNAARVRNRERLRAHINAVTATATVAQWIERLNAAGVPCGRVMNLAEVVSDPQVLAQEMMLEIEHPGHGPVRMTGFPVKLGATPAQLRRPAPGLGEHTDEVLRELGYDAPASPGLRSAASSESAHVTRTARTAVTSPEKSVLSMLRLFSTPVLGPQGIAFVVGEGHTGC